MRSAETTNRPEINDEAELEYEGWLQWERGGVKQAKQIRRQRLHRLNRRRQRENGNLGRKAWRTAPATEEQHQALRVIATETGRTYQVGISRGAAWNRIRQATTLLDERLRLKCAPPWYTPPTPSQPRPFGCF